MEYGQLTVETIDEVAPRLRAFTRDLMHRLKLAGFTVGTTTIFLLNSTDHPIEVPCLVNGVVVHMAFDAMLPVWASTPRARVCVRFNLGKHYFYVERGSINPKTAKFPIRKILKRFLVGVQKGELQNKREEIKFRNRDQAERAFQLLSKDLQAPVQAEDPSIIKLRNIKIKRLDQVPNRVILLLSVTHEEVREIVRRYR